MTKLKAAVAKFEKTKTATQVFRVVRLTVVTVIVAVIGGAPLTAAALGGVVIGAAEAAFRAVFVADAT